MSRPAICVSGGLLALLVAGAFAFAPRTASAGMTLGRIGEAVAAQSPASPVFQSDSLATDGWWQPALPAAQAMPPDGVADVRLSPMFSQTDSASQTVAISVSVPNHFAPPELGQVRGEHVNSIPDLPALWSGLTSLAGILTAGSVKRLRRALK